jgi:hypothetical protein
MQESIARRFNGGKVEAKNRVPARGRLNLPRLQDKFSIVLNSRPHNQQLTEFLERARIYSRRKRFIKQPGFSGAFSAPVPASS